MNHKFVQVTAYKSDEDFFLCSNLSLIAGQKLTATQATLQLQVWADEYALKGYDIKWYTDDLDPDELKLFE